MPELPEVEVVRLGLDPWVAGRVIAAVDVLHPRSVRRQVGDIQVELVGTAIRCASRRGKYLWFPNADNDQALIAHLGMSGQLLVSPVGTPDQKHLRLRLKFADDGPEIRFVDQRTFGHLLGSTLVDDGSGGRVPEIIAHIARDPLDPLFDEKAVVARIRSRGSEIKRALLDQSLVSGIGNIYADEALWRSGLHGGARCEELSLAGISDVLHYAREVMTAALAKGGTSFDSLYVNVNGQSGYFDRSLEAYGRAGQPCARCGALIRRERFMNRSSFSCPQCQPR